MDYPDLRADRRAGNTRCLSVLLLFVLAMMCGSSHAFNTTPSSHDFERGGDRTSLTWLPGEKYSPLTGKMNHQFVDMRFEGNGQLPIVITRLAKQVYKESRLNAVGGYQSINIPHLYFYSEAYKAMPWNCSELHLVFRENRNINRMLKSPITFKDAGKTVSFFSTDARELPSNIGRFPASAHM